MMGVTLLAYTPTVELRLGAFSLTGRGIILRG
mgnify:CR=1 FL=1